MFNDADAEKLVKEDKLPPELISSLLNTYVTECDDWTRHIVRLRNQLLSKHSEDEARVQLRDIVSFTILFPVYKRSARVDHERPDENLFRWMWYEQRQRRDWFQDLKKVVEEDQQIAQWRKQVLAHGVIDPIEYQPLTRQAFQWIMERAEQEASGDQKEIRAKFRKFVMVYGGSVVCRCFEQYRSDVNKLVNWRTPYFLERLVYKTCDKSVDKVIGIKLKELDKTNSNLIKTVE